MAEYHRIRFSLDDGSTLEPMVYAHDADAIYEAWLDGGAEVENPNHNGGEPFPLARDELVSIETVIVVAQGHP